MFWKGTYTMLEVSAFLPKNERLISPFLAVGQIMQLKKKPFSLKDPLASSWKR